MESLSKLGNKNQAGTRRNPTSLTFLDFMEVLRALAPRLYSDTGQSGFHLDTFTTIDPGPSTIGAMDGQPTGL